MTVFPAPTITNGPALAVVATADDRMNRSAGSLIVSSVLTSAFGFAFWIIAARTMSAADVGTGSAVVAALVLLGNMSTLGLRNALPRFLPTTQSNTAKVIAWSYVACAATAVVIGSVFVVGARWWADELTSVRDGYGTQALFVAAVAVWAVFVLQDNVLVGLRTATWVPVENLVYAVVKLGGLVVIASVGSWAIPIAWIVPALAILVPLNVGIFTRLVPGRSSISRTLDDRPIDWQSIGRFAAGDHFADIVRFLGAEGVVLIVLAQLGPEASAPLFFAITIAASLQLVSSNVMSAYVAEAAARPAHADELLRRAAKHITVLVVPGALVAAAAAPLGMALFGSDFVESGTPVLRLLLLAAIPQIALSLAIGQARYRRRVGDVVVLAAAASLAPVIGAAFFVPTYGIVAVGWSVLIGQTVLAAVLLATSLRSLLRAPRDAALNTALATRSKLRQQRRSRAGATVFDELDTSRGDAPRLWPRSVIASENDVVVARVTSEPPRVVKVALSAAASHGLQRHATSLEAMRRATAGTPARQLVPVLLEFGTCMGQTYVVESACRGAGIDRADEATVAAVAGAFSALHQATARPQRPGDDLAYDIVAAPCRTLLAEERLAKHRPVIESLRAALTAALGRRELVVSRTHGDCWLGNVLADASLQPPMVTGVIDWENSLEVGLPEVDLAHLWLAQHPIGMASGTLSALVAGDFAEFVGPCARTPVNPNLPAALVVTLAWLAHVAAGLERSSRFSLGPLWISRNVTPVLDLFEEVGPDRVIR